MKSYAARVISVEATRRLADRLLREIPPEPHGVLVQRRHDLLVGVGDRPPTPLPPDEPSGRRVRGRDGIWRWER